MIPSATASPFDACQRKTFRSALSQFLQTEFGSTFGPNVRQLFVERVKALFEEFHPPRARLSFGQMLWTAVAANHRPNSQTRIEETPLVPIVLDVVTEQDIEDTINLHKRSDIRERKIIRLFRQAYEQGAVLAQADVALILHLTKSSVANALAKHQKATKEIIPSRGSIHDMGTTFSHKPIICYKRLVEKKSTSEVAKETGHSPKAVERYVVDLRRVLACKNRGLNPEETATVVGHSTRLVKEYLDLIQKYDLEPKLRDYQPMPGVPSVDDIPF